MAHLFKQMYVDEVDFEALTIEKFIDLVFTEMIYYKIQNWKKRHQSKTVVSDGRLWRFTITVDDEERWIDYAERASSLLNHDLMWQGMVEVCKMLEYPEPTASHREHFEKLFDMSCLIGFRYILNLKELCQLAIFWTMFCVCTN